MEKDVASVEETLLAFVAQACPDNESRASHLVAARRLIQHARSSYTGEVKHVQNSPQKPTTDDYSPDVLSSCSALQPLLGQAGLADAQSVLKGLHCRMQHLREPAGNSAGQQAPPPCDPASARESEGSASASHLRAAVLLATATEASHRKHAAIQSRRAGDDCSACESVHDASTAVGGNQQTAQQRAHSVPAGIRGDESKGQQVPRITGLCAKVRLHLPVPIRIKSVTLCSSGLQVPLLLSSGHRGTCHACRREQKHHMVKMLSAYIGNERMAPMP